MRKKNAQMLRSWLRDMGLGAMVFLAVPVLASGLSASYGDLGIGSASAADVMATRAVELTSLPGPNAENAIVAAAQLRPGGTLLSAHRLPDLAVLGLTFSLLAAANLAFVRHLRRVNAVGKRGSSSSRGSGSA